MYKEHFRSPGDQNLYWNMYGQGLERIGKDGEPETGTIPAPGPDQILVRVDSVGMCFSDVKLIRQGRNHPKLYNRDLTIEPTRLGHEVSVTVAAVGEKMGDRFHVGQRFAIQPDIYQNGRSTAYGYTVPGGLIQYHLIGDEVLVTDAGECLLPLEEGMGYAESALLEPWGCVVAAYTQRRRLEPLEGGIMWIIGQPGDEADYSFSQYLDRPDTIVITNCPPSLKESVETQSANIIVRDDLAIEDYRALSEAMTGGKGFDDIVVLNPSSGAAVSEIARHIARRGTMNLIGQQPLDSLADADVGRLHYDYIAFVGQSGPEITDSYGEARNRCDLRPDGATVIVGAGGPMGQMHLQRALELPNGPKLLVATDVNQMRLDAIKTRFGPLADAQNRTLIVFNPTHTEETGPQNLVDLVMEVTDQQGADDVVICVPVAALMEEGARMMKDDGMLVLFAGVPNGTEAPLDLSRVYLSNAQYTGTSGLTLDDQALVMQRALAGELSPGLSVAAIGGMDAAIDGIEAMMEGRFPGKIVIFPQIKELPLMGLDDVHTQLPEVAAALGKGNSWTQEAEDLLLQK
ncbi:MAG: alcohol dehydrogenase catalytic domain-containing protein [Chloroflexota bacterium]